MIAAILRRPILWAVIAALVLLTVLSSVSIVRIGSIASIRG